MEKRVLISAGQYLFHGFMDTGHFQGEHESCGRALGTLEAVAVYENRTLICSFLSVMACFLLQLTLT